MASCHIGAVMKPAIDLTIGELSLLPAQTPNAIDGVYPITHASRVSSVVPVLTATSYPGMVSGEVSEYSGTRACAFESIADIVRAVAAGSTREGSDSYVSSTLPCASATSRMPVGALRTPSLPNAA